jgi:quinoprotein dehydrogenase-associated probable ABC transporter substrate-binding protein
MFLVTKPAAVFVLCLFLAGATYAAPPALRICADPNNLPYSNRQQQGIENRLAQILASDLGSRVDYFWFPQRENFFDRTLGAGVCDAVMAVPAGFQEVTATAPYYRSSYVFITRRDRHLSITSFDDPRLKTLRIGVQVLGDGDDNLPPVLALNSRGIIRNVRGYSIFGERLDAPAPQEQLIKAVADKTIDIAVAWGPIAGYFARRSAAPLDLTAVASDRAHPDLPLSFEIAIGVRKGNLALKKKLDLALVRHRNEISQLLKSYGFPEVRTGSTGKADN